MTKNDTVEAPYVEGDHPPWGREDCIRWVEWRVRELTVRNGEYFDERGRWMLDEKAAGGRRLAPGDKVADYAVWLLKERDDLSWHQIAYRFFPNATEANIEKFESRVRRMYDRVERNHPGSKMYRPPRLSKEDKVLLEALRLGVIPVYVSAIDDSDSQS
jgi:hypothetical protein